MYNHNKAQQSKNRVHISWDILYLHEVKNINFAVDMGHVNAKSALVTSKVFTRMNKKIISFEIISIARSMDMGF